MGINMLLRQFSRFKKLELEQSPYHFLLDAHIEPNPHQLNAFCAAIQSLKTGGIVLADEVGLGKTIEAGLVLKYVLEKGGKRILIALPASLRKQWELEFEEKFKLKSVILDRLTIEKDVYHWKRTLEAGKEPVVVLTSYDYSSKLMRRFPEVKWDFLIIDEAHNLRNVFHGTKRAKSLYEVSKGIPKLLLTATPLQNSLKDLHGLISFIDSRIFGSEKVFNVRFIENEDYTELKKELSPVVFRTLRRDVAKYMDFKKRICHTFDFSMSPDEIELYQRVNNFLKKDVLYSIPISNRNLIILVIRKLMASSSFALIETFEILRKRLKKLQAGTKSAKAKEGFDLFWRFVEDEIDEEGFEEEESEDEVIQKQCIQSELDEINVIIDVARRIRTNSKATALQKALKAAFSWQFEQGIDQKVVIFTESKRTQKYIAGELRNSGYDEEDIILFNGDFDDKMSKDIYKAWMAKNFGKENYGRSVEYKHAIVDYFKHNAKILICTDAGSEGLNLQFSNTVINYDLPWNPMKIEQRIGRCHRYGQIHDVVTINLLNTENAADRRVYEILSKKFELFDGVFGASDIALGVLESGAGFEKIILEIYQSCNTAAEFKKAFDKLGRKLDAKRDKKARELRNMLMMESSGAREKSLAKTKSEIDSYLRQVEFWSQVSAPKSDANRDYLKIDNWGEKVIGSHGTLIIGAFGNGTNFLFPVLLLCDEHDEYIDFTEEDLVKALEAISEAEIHSFVPTEWELNRYKQIRNHLRDEMVARYRDSVEPIMEYNRRKIENWERIQSEQLIFQIQEKNKDIDELKAQERASSNFYEKIDIRKKIDKESKALEKMQTSFHAKDSKFKRNGEFDIEEFNKQFDINPVLLVKAVVKF